MNNTHYRTRDVINAIRIHRLAKQVLDYQNRLAAKAVQSEADKRVLRRIEAVKTTLLLDLNEGSK